MDDYESTDSTESDSEYQPSQQNLATLTTPKRRNVETSELFTPHVTGALDRNKTSNREAQFDPLCFLFYEVV